MLGLPSIRIRDRASRLEVAIVVNQLATPGLGSWMAGHRVAGTGQLALASAGFAMALLSFVRMMNSIFDALRDATDLPPQDPSLFYRALIPFGIAWLWSGITSIQMALEVRRLRAAPPTLDLQEPPVLPDPP